MAGFCRYCGNKLDDGSQFCAQCGKAVNSHSSVNAQSRVQASNPVNAQSRVQTPDSADIQSPENNAEMQLTKSQMYQSRIQNDKLSNPPRPVRAKKSGSTALCIILAAVMVIEIAVAGFVSPGFFTKKGDPESVDKTADGVSLNDNGFSDVPKKEVQSDSALVTKDNPVSEVCELTIDAGEMNLLDGEQTVSVKQYEDVILSDGAVETEYDIEIGDHRDFHEPVKIEFPYSATDESVGILHYDEELGEWIPMMTVESEDGKVCALFGSLSPVKVVTGSYSNSLFYVENAGTKDAEIKIAANYWNLLKKCDKSLLKAESDKMLKDPSGYSLEVPTLSENMDVDAVNSAFSTANNIWTYAGPVIEGAMGTLPEMSKNKYIQFMIDAKGPLSEAMNVMPFVMMAAQAGLDTYKDGTLYSQTAALNGYKNLCTNGGSVYSLITGYGNFGFTLTFLGVAIFSMELDAVVDEAKAEQTQNIEKVFDSYYENLSPFSKQYWYDVFYDAYWNSGSDPDKAMRTVLDAVDAHVNKFWDDIYTDGNDELIFATAEAGYKNVFFNATEDQKRELSNSLKLDLQKRIQKETMPMISGFLLEQMQKKTYEQLAKMLLNYNDNMTFVISEAVDPESTDLLKYDGCTLCFGRNGLPIEGWSIEVPEYDDDETSWTETFSCTVFGYMNAGLPYELYVYKDIDSMKNCEEPLFKAEFDASLNSNVTTEIALSRVKEKATVKMLDPSQVRYVTDYIAEEVGGYMPEEFLAYGGDKDIDAKINGWMTANQYVLQITAKGCTYEEYLAILDYYTNVVGATVNGPKKTLEGYSADIEYANVKSEFADLRMSDGYLFLQYVFRVGEG